MLQISRMQELSENADSEMNDLKERSVERNFNFPVSVSVLLCMCVCVCLYLCMCVYLCVSVFVVGG